MVQYHIAQVNIARALEGMENESMSGFVARLDEINALADRSPGFVWRLQSEEDNEAALREFEEPMLVVNLSVWDSIDALRDFVYRSAHVELIRDREAWFGKLGEAHMALWWVPAGHIPSPREAKERLQHMRDHGPSQEAFTFGRPFSAPA